MRTFRLLTLCFATLLLAACSQADHKKTEKNDNVSISSTSAPSNAAESAQKQQAARVIKRLFSTAGNTAIGNPKGDVTMVEFFDYRCGYCKRIAPDLLTLTKANPNLRIVFREYPILGKVSYSAAAAVLAAQAQGKYWALHQALINAKQPLNDKVILAYAKSVGLNTEKLAKAMSSDSVTMQIEKNMQLGAMLGINGTPTFIVGPTPGSKLAQQYKGKPLMMLGSTPDALQQAVQMIKD